MADKNDPFGEDTREKDAIRRGEELLKEGSQSIESFPTVEATCYSCTLIIQKIEEWEKILKKAKNGEIKRDDKELQKIQKKIGDMDNIIFKVHGSSKYPDEVVSKLYYENKETIDEIRRNFQTWKKLTDGGDYADFVNSLYCPKELLETFPINEEIGEDLESVALGIIQGEAYDVAVSFTSIETGISEDRIKHKIKKFYK
jgi:hypothetical protein